MVTFTLPPPFRNLAWAHQRIVYDILIACAWQTLRTFVQNDAELRGAAGAIAVLHTHSRRLDYHPHVHLVIPAAAIDVEQRQWRTRRPKEKGQSDFLFPERALAQVFRARFLEALRSKGLPLPAAYPKKWVAHCKAVGSGEQALEYLARYLYRGVIRERDILRCENGEVTFRYRHAPSGRWKTRTLPGAEFLWLLLRHVLPKRFRRTRNFGFLHPNAKHLIALLQYLHGLVIGNRKAQIPPRPKLICRCCGAPMRILQTRLSPHRASVAATAPPSGTPAAEAAM